MKKITVILSATTFLFFFSTSCKKAGKNNSDADNCAAIQKVDITNAKTSYYVGDSVYLVASPLAPIALYTWFRDINSNTISGDGFLVIYPCTKGDEGWYYLNISYPDCAYKNDSVYVAIHNPPATAPCSPAANTVSFSSIPNINVSSTTFGLDADFNCKKLYADYGGGYPDFSIYFEFYWNDKEPEDGAYDISNTITFDDNNPYSVFISSLYSSVYFQADPGKVYVSHVNGKLQVTFCNITLSGDLGSAPYTTTATGNLDAP
jgi:hypothetical protein